MSQSSADVDTAAVESFLADALDETVTDTAVLHDGLNLIVEIATAGDDDAYVLRAPRKLRDAAYMNDLPTEYAVVQHLADTPVPAPEPILYCDDESILGEPFYVMTRLDGDVVDLGSNLPERFRTPAARRAFAHGLIDTLADVHGVDTEPLADGPNRRTPREEVAQSVDRLERAVAATDLQLPRLHAVGEWLLENAPPDHETALVHGDFRPGNVPIAGTDTPEIGGVLDWETALLGDPLTDLGYLLLRWRDAGDATPSLDGFDQYDDDVLDHYREVNDRGLAPFTAEAGSPTRQELVGHYEERTGRTFENWRFYVTYGAFGLATVWADLNREAAAAGEGSTWEPHIEYVTRLTETVVDGEFEL